jgi:hypothetical protein
MSRTGSKTIIRVRDYGSKTILEVKDWLKDNSRRKRI